MKKKKKEVIIYGGRPLTVFWSKERTNCGLIQLVGSPFESVSAAAVELTPFPPFLSAANEVAASH